MGAVEPSANHAPDEPRLRQGEEPSEERSLVDALERVTQAGVEVLESRAELIQLEIRRAGARLASAAVCAVGATFLLLVGWVALMSAGFVLLREPLGAVPALLTIGVVNGLLGLVAVAVGYWRSRGT